jgi:ABC-type uncharacterized transport system substrate-binding protein
MMRRREFISLVGGAAAAWPFAARAQQAERMRRIGVLMGFGADDLEGRNRLTAFLQALQQFGWTDGRTVRIDIRWGGPNADDIRKLAAELVKLAPDVILTSSSVVTSAMLQATRTIPIVFTIVIDPVGAAMSTQSGEERARGLINRAAGLTRLFCGGLLLIELSQRYDASHSCIVLSPDCKRLDLRLSWRS